VIFQRLTDYLWVGLDSVESRITNLARTFYALKDSLEKLDSYHKGVELTDSPAESCYFPSIISYRDEDGLVSWKTPWTAPLFACRRPPGRLGWDIVVKFVDWYGAKAHNLLAGAGLAPKLFFYGSPRFNNTQLSYESLSMASWSTSMAKH